MSSLSTGRLKFTSCEHYSSYNKGEGSSSGVTDNRAFVGERRERESSGAGGLGVARVASVLLPALMLILCL